jgi:hypothetical protein
MTDTISLPEIIWTLVGFIGVGVHVGLAVIRYIDLKVAEKYKADTVRVRLLANSNVRRQILYAVAQLGMASIGIVSMTIPPIDKEYNTTDTIGSILFITIEAVLLINGIWDYYDNNRMNNTTEGTLRSVADNS